jgi:hypothetical protein
MDIASALTQFLSLFKQFDFINAIIVILAFVAINFDLRKKLKHLLQGSSATCLQSLIKSSIEEDTIIHQALDSLVDHLHASRAFLIQYHNGGTNVADKPFTKLTMTHEHTAFGIHKIQSGYQSVPSGVMAYFNKLLCEEKQVVVRNVTELQQIDLSSYQLLHQEKILSAYMVGLFSLSGVFIGAVGIHYCSGPHSLTPDQWQKLRATSQMVCGRLMNEKTCNLEN